MDGWPHEVSSRGRVRKGERVIAKRTMESGYVYVTLIDGKRRKDCRLHRLVLLAWKGECPEGMEACHGDRDKQNNRLWNLRYDTRLGNANDKRRHGTMPTGSTHGRARLHEEDIPKIREQIAAGLQYEDIAAQYGVNASSICHIHKGRTWRHV